VKLKLKSVDIACQDISSSALFYIGLLELDVLDSFDDYIELCDGINLLSYQEYYDRTGTIPSKNSKSQSLVIELEVLSFDKFLFKLYQCDSNIDYTLSVANNKRILRLHDPDGNLLVVTEADDKTKKKSYEPNIARAEDILERYSTSTFVFEEKESR